MPGTSPGMTSEGVAKLKTKSPLSAELDSSGTSPAMTTERISASYLSIVIPAEEPGSGSHRSIDEAYQRAPRFPDPG